MPFGELKKAQTGPQRLAWAVAILLLLALLVGAGYGLFGFVSWLVSLGG